MPSRRPTRSDRSRRVRPLRVEQLEPRITPTGGLASTALPDATGVQLHLAGGETVEFHGRRASDIASVVAFFGAADGAAAPVAVEGRFAAGGETVTGSFGLAERGPAAGVSVAAAGASVSLGGGKFGVTLAGATGAFAIVSTGVAGTVTAASVGGGAGPTVFGLPGLVASSAGLRYDLNTTGAAQTFALAGPGGPVAVSFPDAADVVRFQGSAAFAVSSAKGSGLTVAATFTATELPGGGLDLAASAVTIGISAGTRRVFDIVGDAADFRLALADDGTPSFTLAAPETFEPTGFNLLPESTGLPPLPKATVESVHLGPLTMTNLSLTLPQIGLVGSQLSVGVGLKADTAGLSFGQAAPEGQSAPAGGQSIAATATNVVGTFTLGSAVDPATGLAGDTTTSGGFSLGFDTFDVEVPDLFKASAEKGVLAYNSGLAAGQTLFTASKVAIDAPKLKLAGEFNATDNSPALEIRDNGFAFGDGKLTVSKTFSLSSLVTVTNPYFQVTDFSYTQGQPVQLGGVAVGASEFTISKAGKAFSLQVENPALAVTLDGLSRVTGFTFSADSLSASLGTYLTVGATNFTVNPLATGTDPVLSVNGTATAHVVAGKLDVAGSIGKFAVLADGRFQTKPGFGVSFDTSKLASGLFGVPSFLPVALTSLGLTWPDFAGTPGDFVVSVSGSVDAKLGGVIAVSGSVTDLQVRPSRLAAGRSPILGIGGFSISASGTVGGAGLSGALILGVVKFDADGVRLDDSATDYADTTMFVGIKAGFSIPGVAGLTVKFAFTESGPLSAYLSSEGGILIEPISGLSLGNFRGGITFNAKPLVTPTDPDQLDQPDYQPTTSLTDPQWRLQTEQQVANIAAGSTGYLFSLKTGAADAATALDAGTVTPELDAAFTAAGKVVSRVGAAATVTATVPGSVWELSFRGSNYVVRQVTADDGTVSLRAFGLLFAPLASSFATDLAGGKVTAALAAAFSAGGYSIGTSDSVTVATAGSVWSIKDGLHTYNLRLFGGTIVVTGGGGALGGPGTVFRIEAGADLYSTYASANAIRGGVDLIVTTDGKFLIAGTITLGDSVSLNAKLFADLSTVNQADPTAPVTFVFKGALPAPTAGSAVTAPPLVTVKGLMTFAFYDTAGNLMNPRVGGPKPAAFEFVINGQATVGATSFASLVVGGSLGPNGKYAELKLRVDIPPQGQSGLGKLTIDVSGSLSVEGVIKAGDLVSGAGRLVLEQHGSGAPTVYGALEINFTTDSPGLSFLRDAGLSADADLLIGFNTTGDSVSVPLSLPGRDPVTVLLQPQTLLLEAQGSLTFHNSASVAGTKFGADIDILGAFSAVIGSDPSGGLQANLFVAGTIGIRVTLGQPLNLFTLNGVGLIALQHVGEGLTPIIAGRLDLIGAYGVPGVLDVTGSAELLFNSTGKEFTYVVPDRLQARLVAIQAASAKNAPALDFSKLHAFVTLPGGAQAVVVPAAPPTLAGATPFAAGPYFFVALGDLTPVNQGGLGPVTVTLLNAVKLEGAFQITVGSSGFELRADAQASIALPGASNLFHAHAAGFVRVTAAGLVGAISIDAGLNLSVPGLAADAKLKALIGVNTTGTADGSFVFDGKAITLPAQSAQVFLSGSITLGGFALDGSFRVTVGAQAITLAADAHLTLFNQSVFTVTATAAIYYNQANSNNNGLVLAATVGFGGTNGSFGVKGIFTAGANLELDLDTRPASFLAKVAVTNARLSLLDAITFTGSGSITISAAGFRVSGSFTANLFDVATVSANGYFDSDGTFSVHLSGGINLGTNDYGIQAGFSLDASYQPGVFGTNVLKFSGSGYGRLRAFGVTIAGGNVGIRYDGDTGKITADAGVTVAGNDLGTIHLTLGYLKIDDGSIPSLGRLVGNTLILNSGGDDDEAFLVDAIGLGTTTGEYVRVRAFGTTATFDDVTFITAGFGDGTDELRLQSHLGTFRGMKVQAVGGRGSATFLNSSSAVATFTGGSGNSSVLSSDNALDTLTAGAGDTTLSGGASQVGGAGRDRFVWNLGTPAPTVTGGTSADTLVVSGTSAAESYAVGGTAGVLSVTVGGATVTAAGVGKVEVTAAGGADTVAVNLAGLRSAGVTSARFDLSQTPGVTTATSTGGDATYQDDGAIDALVVSGGDAGDSYALAADGADVTLNASGVAVRLVKPRRANDTLTINGGTGADVFTVAGPADGTSAGDLVGLALNGGVGDDTFTLPVGAADFSGGPGSNSATFTVAAGDDTALTVSAARVSNARGSSAYSGLTSVTLVASVPVSVAVQSTAAGTATTVLAPGGAVNVLSTSGPLNVTAAATTLASTGGATAVTGDNAATATATVGVGLLAAIGGASLSLANLASVTFDDSLDGTGRVVSLTGTALTGTAASASISQSNLGAVRLKLGLGNDTAAVAVTGTAVSVTSSGGTDAVNATLARSAAGVLAVTTDGTVGTVRFTNATAGGGSPWVLDLGTLTANGNAVLVTAPASTLALTVNPGPGGTVRVQRVDQPTTLTLAGNGGTLTVGGTVGAVTATLDDIAAPLTLGATSGGQTLLLDDTAGDLNLGAPRLRTITNGAITGPGQKGAISYDAAKFGTVRATFGPANDRVTLAGATSVASVNVGTGTNAVTAGGTLSNALAVLGGTGNDTLTLTPGTGRVTFTGGGGIDAAVLDATAVVTNSKGDFTGLVARLEGLPRLTFASAAGASLAVKLGAGNATFDVDTTTFAGDFQVTSGGGNNLFAVRNVPTAFGQYRFQGGAGADTLTLRMNAPTAGQFAKVLPAVDQLVIDDSSYGGAVAWVSTGTAVTANGLGVVDTQGAGRVSILGGGSSANSLTVSGTGANPAAIDLDGNAVSVSEGLAVLGQSGTPSSGLAVPVTLGSLGGASVVAATADGTLVFAAGPNDGSVTVLRSSPAGFTLVENFTTAFFTNATALAVSADGRYLFAATLVNGNAAIFSLRIDAVTGRLSVANTVVIGVSYPFVALLPTPDGLNLLALHQQGQQAGIDPLVKFTVNAARGGLAASQGYLNFSGEIAGVALTLSDDGGTLYAAKKTTVDVYTRSVAGTLTLARTLNATTGLEIAPFRQLSASGDGQFLFSLASDGTLSAQRLQNRSDHGLTPGDLLPVAALTVGADVGLNAHLGGGVYGTLPFAYDAATGILAVVGTVNGDAIYRVLFYRYDGVGFVYQTADAFNPTDRPINLEFHGATLDVLLAGYRGGNANYAIAGILTRYGFSGSGSTFTINSNVRGDLQGAYRQPTYADGNLAVVSNGTQTSDIFTSNYADGSNLVFTVHSNRNGGSYFPDTQFAGIGRMVAMAVKPGTTDLWTVTQTYVAGDAVFTLRVIRVSYNGTNAPLENLDLIATVDLPTATNYSSLNLQFSPDGGTVYLFTGGSGPAMWLPTADPANLVETDVHAISTAALTGRWLGTLTIGSGGRVYVADSVSTDVTALTIFDSITGATPTPTGSADAGSGAFVPGTVANPVTGLAVSPDNKVLYLTRVTGGVSGLVLDAGGGVPVAVAGTFAAPGVAELQNVTSLTRSGTSLYLTSTTGANNSVVRYDLNATTGLPTGAGAGATAASAAFNDGSAVKTPKQLVVANGTAFVASAGTNGVASLNATTFNASTAHTAVRGQSFTSQLPGFDAVATSADGRYVYGVSTAGNAVTSLDTTNGVARGFVDGFDGATALAGVSLLAVRASGNSDYLYALAPSTGTVTVVRRRSIGNLTIEGTFTDASLVGATAFVWSASNSRLYAGTGTTVRRFDLGGNLPIAAGSQSVTAPAAVTALAVDAAGRVYAAGGGRLSVYASNLGSAPVTVSGLPNATAVLAAGNRVFVAGSDGSLTALRWDAGFTALAVETTFRQGVGGVTGLSGVSSLAVSTDGRFVFATGPLSGGVSVFALNAVADRFRFTQNVRDGRGVNGVTTPTGLAVIGNTLWVSSRTGPGGSAGGFAPLTITAPGATAQPVALLTTFGNVSALTIEGSAQPDTLRVLRAPDAKVSSVTVNGGGGGDTVSVFDVGNGKSLAVNPGPGVASVTVNQTVANSGSAALTITADSGSTAVSIQSLRGNATVDLLAAGVGATDIVRVSGAGLASGATLTVKGNVATQPTSGSAIVYGGNGVLSPNGTDGTVTLAGRGSVSYTGFRSSGPLQQVLVQGTPTPAITVSPAGGIAEGDTVTFTVADGANLPGVTFGWDFNGDGNFGDAAGASVTLTWAQLQSFGIRSLGNYAVAARATSTQSVAFAGQTYTSSADAGATLAVSDTAPTLATPTAFAASLGVPYTVPLLATDPGDTAVTGWSVNWGDGTTDALGATATAAAHAYANPGDYLVTVTVTDTTGSTSTSYIVAARPSVGSVTLSGPYAVTAADALVVTPTAPGTPLRYEWSLNGGGTVFTTAGPTPTLTATLDQLVAAGVTGLGTVTLTVTAVYTLGAGTVQSSSSPVTLSVVNPAPAGTLTPSVLSVPERSVAGAITLTVTGLSPTFPGTTYTVRYNFSNDGTTFTAPTAPGVAVSVPAGVFVGSGPKTLRAVVTDSFGTSTTLYSTVTVTVVAPVLVLTPPAGSVGEGTAATVTATLTDPGLHVTGFLVSWGDGTTAAYADPNARTFTHAYASGAVGGTAYAVTVVARSPTGDVSAAASVTVVNVAPSVGLTTATPTVTLGVANAFVLNVAVADAGTDTVLGYAVDWGDGTSTAVVGSNFAPSHTYATLPAGATFTVRLQSFTDSSGTYAPAATLAVAVTNAPPVLVAGALRLPALGSQGQPLALAAVAGSVATGRRDLTYTWAVTAPDGGTSTTTGANGFVSGVTGYEFAVGNAASFTPLLPGDYAVTLTVTDGTGASATTGPRTVSVPNTPPTVTGFAVPDSGTQGQAVALSATGSSLTPGAVLTYTWAVTSAALSPAGVPLDSVTLTGTNPQFTPKVGGDYSVRLTVTDALGATDGRSARVAVTLVGPSVTATVAPAATVADSVTFTAVATDPSGTAPTLTWRIVLPTGAVVTASGLSVPFTYGTPGTYSVQVTATGAGGATASSPVTTVVVANVAPVITPGSIPTAGAAGRPSTFTATASYLGGGVLSFVWTFTAPDGTTTQFGGTGVTFTPPDLGTYGVKLQVLDGFGGVAAYAAPAFVAASTGPTAGPLPVPAGVTAGDTVTLSLPAISGTAAQLARLTYTWTVTRPGDTTLTLTGPTPTFVTTASGSIGVSLRIDDTTGGTATVVGTVAVANLDPTLPTFAVPSVGYAGVAVTLRAAGLDATAETLTYTWTVSAPGVATRTLIGSEVTFTPDAAGNYGVSLTVTDGTTGSVSRTASVAIAASTVTIAAFTVPAAASRGDTVALSASAAEALGNLVAYTWTVTPPTGAAFALAGPTPTFVASLPGPYGVALVVTSSAGRTTASAAVAVANLAPAVSLSGPAGATRGAAVTLVALGTPPAGLSEALSYEWTVTRPDGSTFTQAGATLSFVPTQLGFYAAVVAVTDPFGAAATARQVVSVLNTPPVAAFSGGSVPEAGTVRLDALPGSSDAEDATAALVFAWDFDGNGLFGEAVTAFGDERGAAPTFHAGATGPAALAVSLRVTDSNGASTVTRSVITVTNVGPVLGTPSVVVTPPAAPGGVAATVRIDVPYTTVAPTVPLSATMTWGDGTATPGTVAAGRVTAEHAYTAGGTYAVTVTLADAFGGTAQAVVTVPVPAVVPVVPPVDPPVVVPPVVVDPPVVVIPPVVVDPPVVVIPPVVVPPVTPPVVPVMPKSLTRVSVTVGPGGVVRVTDSATGALLFEVTAFVGFDGPVTAIVGDTNADGTEDVIVAAGAGGGPRVRVFDGRTGATLADFFAYDAAFRGGVNAAFDPDSDALVTGAGPGGGPHVKVFDGRTLRELAGFFAYESGFRGGVNVAVLPLDGGRPAEVVIGAGVGGGPAVAVFDLQGHERGRYYAFDPAGRGGAAVAAGAFGTGPAGLIAAAEGPGTPAVVAVTDAATLAPLARGPLAVPARTDGVRLASARGPSGRPALQASLGTDPFAAVDLAFLGGVFVG